jgi:hypothetical protein
MKDIVAEGDELMPQRIQYNNVVDSQAEISGDNSQPALTVNPIRNISKNQGPVLQEEVIVEESPECNDENASRATAIRRCRRKLP